MGKEKYCENCLSFWSMQRMSAGYDIIGMLRTSHTTHNPNTIPRAVCPFCGDYSFQQALIQSEQ